MPTTPLRRRRSPRQYRSEQQQRPSSPRRGGNLAVVASSQTESAVPCVANVPDAGDDAKLLQPQLSPKKTHSITMDLPDFGGWFGRRRQPATAGTAARQPPRSFSSITIEIPTVITMVDRIKSLFPQLFCNVQDNAFPWTKHNQQRLQRGQKHKSFRCRSRRGATGSTTTTTTEETKATDSRAARSSSSSSINYHLLLSGGSGLLLGVPGIMMWLYSSKYSVLLLSDDGTNSPYGSLRFYGEMGFWLFTGLLSFRSDYVTAENTDPISLRIHRWDRCHASLVFLLTFVRGYYQNPILSCVSAIFPTACFVLANEAKLQLQLTKWHYYQGLWHAVSCLGLTWNVYNEHHCHNPNYDMNPTLDAWFCSHI